MINDEDQRILETFVTTMYDRSSASTGVNAARLDLFARKQRPYAAIPGSHTSCPGVSSGQGDRSNGL